MRRLKHPNIVQMYGICSKGKSNKSLIIQEFHPRGNLYKILHKDNIKLPVHRQIKLAIDIAHGLNYLHNLVPKIIHRDLKPHK